MARIPDEELARIKSQVTVEDLCRDYGIELDSHRAGQPDGPVPVPRRPHAELRGTPSKNLWNCLAGCGGGDVIELVMRKENVSFRQAVDVLRQRLGILPEDPTIETRSGTTHPMLVPASETELADHVLLKHVLDFYHQTFCDDVKAMRYLQARRCFDAEAVKLFQIGYANRTLCYRVPSTTAAGRRLKEQLQRLGVIRKSGHEHLSGSVIVPIFDEHGNVRRCTPARSRGPCGKGRRCTCTCPASIALPDNSVLHFHPLPRRIR